MKARSKALFALLTLAVAGGARSEPEIDYIKANAISLEGPSFSPALLTELKTKKIILVGEMHGSNEMPAFVYDLVTALAKSGARVGVGLEIPVNYQSDLATAVANQSVLTLTQSGFFQKTFQDGRQSFAMAQLIASVGTKPGVSVFAFDRDEASTANDRDRAMAQNVLQRLGQGRDDILVLLAGNLHTRVGSDAEASAGFKPMGHYLSRLPGSSLTDRDLLAIMGRHEQGGYWACFTADPAECGEKRFSTDKSNYAVALGLGRYLLKEPARADGHDATIFIRTLTAARPLMIEGPERSECRVSAASVESYLEQDFWTFDQSPFGHRSLWQPPLQCKAASAQLIDAYLLTSEKDALPDWQRRVLFFHAGQDYAMADAKRLAVRRFARSFDPAEASEPTFHWNAYVRATIAFLQGDLGTLVAAHAAFGEPTDPGDLTNRAIVERFLRCPEASYLEAYSGTGRCPR